MRDDELVSHKQNYKPTDQDRKEFYTRVLTMVRMWEEKVPGGVDGAMVVMCIGMGRILGSPVSVSEVANMTGFSRAKVLRMLPDLEAEGWCRIEQQPWRTFIHSTFPNEKDSVHQSWMDESLVTGNEYICAHWAHCPCRTRPCPCPERVPLE